MSQCFDRFKNTAFKLVGGGSRPLNTHLYGENFNDYAGFQRESAETNALEILQNLDCTIKYRFYPLCSNIEYREREKE